jgi:hypothetical protein
MEDYHNKVYSTTTSYNSRIANQVLAVGFHDEYFTNSLACPYNPITLCRIKYGTYNPPNHSISVQLVNSDLTRSVK